MKGFYIDINNNLLDPKHYKQMGQAVWLFMWLLDRVTSVNENGVGNVLNRPITYNEIYEELPMPRITYQRHIDRLRKHGYINTIQAQYGIYITVNKTKKSFGKKVETGSIKNDTATKSGVITNDTSDDKKRYSSSVKSDTALYKEDNSITNNTLTNIGDLKIAEFEKAVSKMYYDAIKALDIPITNHNNLRAKIKEMARDPEREKIYNYLSFMASQFGTLDWKFKPSVNEALEIYTKRARVRNTFAAHVKSKQTGGVTKIS